MYLHTVAYLLVTLLALSCVTPRVNADMDPEKLNKMVETLKILQSLDKHYGHISRPRFGKRQEYPRMDRYEDAMNEDGMDGKPWESLLR